MKHVAEKTLQEVAHFLGAQVSGDASAIITGIASLENAVSGNLAFLTNKQYRKFLQETKASAVLLSEEDAPFCPVPTIITKNPRLSLALVAGLFEQKPTILPGIHPTAIIGKKSNIPDSVSIGPYCVLGEDIILGESVVLGAGVVIGNGTKIGNQTVLKPNVTLYDNIHIGAHCLIHSGTVIGSDGFGFAHSEGHWIKIPHLGGVTIGDHVEIGANTSIDRGVFENTTIGEGVIIDNLVQIAHNVVIGDYTAIAGCVGIAGSTKIGKHCLIGGGASIAGHLEIVDAVHITATSGVNRSLLKSGSYSSGFPAKASQVWRKNVARFQFIDDMSKRLKMLEKVMMHFIPK